MQKNGKKTFRHPNKFVVSLGKGISRFLCKYIYNVKIVRNELDDQAGRCVIIANHESVIDVLPTYAIVPQNTHFVISKAMMQTMPIAPLIEMSGAISKNQFQTSTAFILRISRALVWN